MLGLALRLGLAKGFELALAGLGFMVSREAADQSRSG